MRVDRPFDFLQEVNAVPINVNEFGFVARNYPIVFAPGNETNPPVPLAVLSFRANDNLFIENGVWEQGCYIPAYIRRYPFIFAADEQQQRFALAIDVDADVVGENADTPIFEGENLSQMAQQAMEFCRNFQQGNQETRQVGEILRQHDLLTQQEATIQNQNGERQVVSRYMGVDGTKLNNLPDNAFIELRRANALPYIYTHMMSMTNWSALIDRAGRRQQAANVDAPADPGNDQNLPGQG
jgi:hypothetical protein